MCKKNVQTGCTGYVHIAAMQMFCHFNAYSSSMSGSEEVAVELGIRMSRIMRDKGKLGIRLTGSGQRDSTHGVSHEERLMRCITKSSSTWHTQREMSETLRRSYHFIFIINFDSLDRELQWDCSLTLAVLQIQKCCIQKFVFVAV